MRNAALTLGVIAGVFGMIVGFFSYGYTVAIQEFGEIDGLAEQVANVNLIRSMAVIAPILAIAGGAMARSRALWGGILLLLSAAGMYYAFGIGLFTIFPVTFAMVAGVLAIAAGKPDEPKAHF
ncbi:MAG: hypothetical protein KUG70_07480 [Rhodobacteraceae bacterium]|nr:hypothetical protein [Paracoccaceae bacterium]